MRIVLVGSKIRKYVLKKNERDICDKLTTACMHIRQVRKFSRSTGWRCYLGQENAPRAERVVHKLYRGYMLLYWTNTLACDLAIGSKSTM